MNFKKLIKLRSKNKIAPRLKARTVTPRLAKALENRLEPVYERALEDYKQHRDEVVPKVMRKYGYEPIDGEAFPEGEPELRIVDRILGAESFQGLSFTEQLNGVHSVVNIAEAVSRDPYKTMVHELYHSDMSQRGMDYGDDEEDMADEIAHRVARRAN